MITPRKLYALKSAMFLVMAIVVPSILAFSSGEAEIGVGGIVACGGLFLAIAGYHWFRYKKTSPDAVFYDITKQPPEEQIAVSKKALWILLILGPALSFWTYHDLSALETGSERSVSVWAPVAMLYNNFGFWSAVFCWPVFCGFGAAMAFFRMEKAKSILTSKNA